MAESTPRASKEIYSYCIDLLSRRAYSSYKICRKLKQKKYPQNEIDIVVRLLTAERYLRDDLYAEARVRSWMAKGNSSAQIKRMLQAEKLSLTLDQIQNVFNESNKSEDNQIEVLIEKQFRKITSIPTDKLKLFKLKQKITAALVRKGHAFSLIRRAIDRRLVAHL